MKHKVNQYRVFNKGRNYDILVFPYHQNAWAFNDYPEEDQLMIDGDHAFFQTLHYAIAILISDPSKIIYFPIKHHGDTSYGEHMTYDAVLMRPELQFRRSEWYDLKSRLDHQHWVGKYTIDHDPQKLDDYWLNLCRKYSRWVDRWDRRMDQKFYKDVTEELLGETVFLVLPKDVCYMYHRQITHALEGSEEDPNSMHYAVLGYLMPPPATDEDKEL